MNWKQHIQNKEKEADRSVPCGEYDVVVADVVSKTSRKNPESHYLLLTFGDLLEGEVPGIYLYNDMHTGDAHKDAWLHRVACKRIETLAASAGIEIPEEVDDDDPVYDVASRLIGYTVRVKVVDAPSAPRGKDTVPVEPYGI